MVELAQSQTTDDRKARLQAALRKDRLKAATSGQSIEDLIRGGIPKAGYSKPDIDPEMRQMVRETVNPGSTMDVPQVDLVGDAMRQSPDRPSRLQALAGNFANSMTFGNAARIAALPALIPGGDTYPEAFEERRNALKMSREDYPATSFAGDLGGFVAPGGVIAKGANVLTRGVVNAAQRAGPALGFLAKTGQAAIGGAAAGAGYGATVGAENEAAAAGEAPPDVGERLAAAGAYAPAGAAFGAAMPAAGVILRPAGRVLGGIGARIAEPFKPGSIQRFNEKVGLEAARRSMERAGILNIEDFLKRAQRYGDKPVVTGELGQDSLNSLVSLVRSKGTTADKAMAVLEERVSGLPGRMLKDIADETGLKPDEVFGAVEDMVKAGRARAAPAYEASEAAPFAETSNLERLVRDAPILRSLYPRAEARVQNQAVTQIGQADQMPPIKVYDELKQLVDEEINKRLANGQGIDDIEGVRKALVNELDLISGQAATGEELPAAGSSLYGKAREAGGDAPKTIAGLKSGERALSGAKLSDDVEREVSQMMGGELSAYQAGVIRNLVKEVENGRLTPRRIKTQGFEKKLRSVFGDPAAEGLMRRFGVESELITKGSRWNPNVGAVTSQAQLGAPSKAADDMIQAAASAVSGRPLNALAKVASLVRKQGYSEGQLNELGNVLLEPPSSAAKRLYPGQTPRSGSIPPSTPPAGRVRDNKGGGNALSSSNVVPIKPSSGGNALNTSAPPPTRAESRAGEAKNVIVYRGVRSKNKGDGGDAFYSTNPNVARRYSENGEIEQFELDTKGFSELDAEGGLPGGTDVYKTRYGGGPGAVFKNVADHATSSTNTIYNPKGKVDLEKVSDTQYYVVDPKRLRKVDATPPPPQKGGNALAEPPKSKQPRQRINTRASIKDVSQEYRDIVMNAPEGHSQAEWDRIRKATGNRLPSPRALQYRIREIELKGNPSPAELRELDALRTMKNELSKFDYD